MKKVLFYISLFLLITNAAYAQRAIGTWQSYLSYHNVTQTEPAGNLIYALGNGSLFCYDTDDKSIEVFSKVNLLNDTEISYIKYIKEYKTLLIVYSDANIDLLIDNKQVYNIPDYMNKNLSKDKKINQIYVNGNYAYMSTAFGIVVLDIKNKEITNSYVLDKVVNACTIANGYIYAATDNGLFKSATTDNLLDINNWIRISSTVFNSLVFYDNELIGTIENDGIYNFNTTEFSTKKLFGGNYLYLNVYDDKLIAGNGGAILLFTSASQITYMEQKYNINKLSYNNGTYWAAAGDDGLLGMKYNETNKNMDLSVESIIPDSPIRNFSYFMKFEGERLLITGGGISGNRLNRKGTIMMFENNTWTNFQENGIKDKTTFDYKDITSIAQDPRDPTHHFASSCGEGVYEFKNSKFVKLWSLDNSTLESAVDDANKYVYVRTNGLLYDSNNNLWVMNTGVKDYIHVYTSDNKWVKLYYQELTDLNDFGKSIIDSRGNYWGISTWYTDYGVFCLNYNNTISTTSDDQHKFLKKFVNQDGSQLSVNRLYCITEDKDGVIWLGTGQGPLVISNPSNFFNDDFYFTQIKVPRNDGTNLADYLLVNDVINSIAVDGANRKWVGTEANGIYLLSADGLQTIHHFTTENSPLSSNSITNIAINPVTGTVFIGTGKGLVSYQSDATEGGESFSDDVHAYPNPVNPDYDGVITITGLIRDTNVKITNGYGKVIYEGTSVGGQFTWNGKNVQGHRVASGVYYVLAADKDGNQGVATKILIVK